MSNVLCQEYLSVIQQSSSFGSCQGIQMPLHVNVRMDENYVEVKQSPFHIHTLLNTRKRQLRLLKKGNCTKLKTDSLMI